MNEELIEKQLVEQGARFIDREAGLVMTFDMIEGIWFVNEFSVDKAGVVHVAPVPVYTFDNIAE